MSIKKNKLTSQLFFMELALRQASKVLGNTKDNPAVGCVISKNNNIIALGNTSINGRPHAEINAINFSKKDLSKSDIYITLEPCSNYGLTKPCVKTIIKKKFKRVYFSVKDPDVRSFNKSEKKFKKNKIKVFKSILKKEINFFYRSYIKFKIKKLPFVTSKVAISKDFYTIHNGGNWITNDFSRGRVHLIRSQHDCIITSYKTVIKDNPMYTCRISGLLDRTPARIILDSKLSIPTHSTILKQASKYPTYVFYNKINIRKLKVLKKMKVNLCRIKLNRDKKINLVESLRKAKQLGFSRILLESGLKLTESFLKEKLIDDFKLFISHKKLKKNGSASMKKCFNKYFKNKKKYIENVNLFGDKYFSYSLK